MFRPPVNIAGINEGRAWEAQLSRRTAEFLTRIVEINLLNEVAVTQ
jgi:hypothetical protein